MAKASKVIFCKPTCRTEFAVNGWIVIHGFLVFRLVEALNALFNRLSNDVVYNISVHVGESEIATRIAERKLGVIKS